MASLRKIARRTFLIGSAAIAGGVAFGVWRYKTPYANPIAGAGIGAITPYVLIDPQGVTIITPRAEMGQGIQSTLAALVAEELDLPWEQVRVMHGPPAKAYYNGAMLEDGVPFAPTDESWMADLAREAMAIPGKFLALQATGGSTSIPDGYEKMRAAGAVARAALIAAAAERLGVDAQGLSTQGGAVVAPDGTRLPYTELAVAAAAAELPDTPPLKPRSEWKLLGKSLPRVDMVAKSTGTEVYAGDIRLPGMKFATVKMNPALGAAMNGFDASAAMAMPGVEKIIPLDGGVAVVAATTWHAIQAAEAITFDWAAADYPANSDEMRAQVAASFVPDSLDATNRDEGDVSSMGAEVFEAEYLVPHLAHATMEPMQAAAHLVGGKLTVWVGTQFPGLAQKFAAKAAGVAESDVELHTTAMGGGFGRRGEVDATTYAAQIAKAMEGTPVLVTWSREEDMTHDMYRPMAIGRVRAALKDGRIDSFDFATASSSIMETLAGRVGLPLMGPDATLAQGAWEQPYGFANYRVSTYRAPRTVPLGFWRSVGASVNVFFHESAVDELAHLAAADPLAFRLAQIKHEPSRKVLEAVAEMSSWGTPRPGRALGLAFAMSFGVPTAEVIEVAQTSDGVRITGAWAAVDVGVALDPHNIQAQVSGAMVYGLSAAVRGEITFADGRVEQQNFWDYEPLRLSQVPDIQVRVLESGGKIRGIGEPGTPPAAPALANALFKLTGKRVRSLPLSKEFDFA
ncbi:MAG: molybdopterin-dependent oxidoreductase [Rhodobacteraceae bacterium]|nr:molybdopterin-dependent oxidoreductase [Paracoccaceae bacterium]MCF8513180.1 molybdopterin-dependent oxidoreductase [Paracoccaceae bacterium]MCF8517424.1 molybdopterin-dependent oxidoreductase [Paracoccaceae bacterium]